VNFRYVSSCRSGCSTLTSHLQGSKGKDDLGYWNEFVQRFFSHKAFFRHTILIKEGESQDGKQYELAYPSLARYFHTHYESGIKTMQLVLDKVTADKQLPNDCHFMESKASLVYWFESGSHVSVCQNPPGSFGTDKLDQLVATGVLRAQFDSEQKIELFEFATMSHDEYISRDVVIQSARPLHNWNKEWRSLNQQDGTHSPEMSNKKSKPKGFKSPNSAPPEFDLPQSSTKHGWGITHAVHQFLGVCRYDNLAEVTCN